MFGFIWVLLEKIATKILKEDIKAWSDRLAIRDQEIDALDRVAERNRIELMELRAKHDREIESLREIVKEREKCIDRQLRNIGTLVSANEEQAKLIKQQEETMRVLKNINSAQDADIKRKDDKIKDMREKIEARDSLVHALSAKIHAAMQNLS